MKLLSYIIPIFSAALFVSLIALIALKCNDVPKYNNVHILQQKEKNYIRLIDSLKKNAVVKSDTFYIEKIKIKQKNDTIFIQQKSIANISDDSTLLFFLQRTGHDTIHD